MPPTPLHEFFRRLAAAHPNPKSELNYTNPYTLLVAVVLSAQATDKGVNKATAPLFAKVQTPEHMLKLGETKLKAHLKTINLLNTKTKNILALSKILIEKFHSQVPRTREVLETLPGVGRKTANVVLHVAFGEPTIAVDTHVFRVAKRTGLAKGSTPEKVEQELLKNIPKEWHDKAHHLLILHGRYVCKARTPACPTCPVADLCPYKEKTPPATKP